MGSGYRSLAGAVQIYAWTNAFIYPELLNSVDMTAYFYETFYHLKGDALQQALTLNLGDTLSMPDGQSLQDLSSYNASDIDAKFDQGMAYYLQNKDAIVAADPELEASSTLVKSYESNHPNVTRLAGDTRFDTMEQIDATGFDSADTVVLTSSTSFADALSASSLAGVNNAPILITDSQTLSDQTKATIARLGASKVYLIGGEAAVSSDVENQLQALKTSAGANVSVERISGEDRRATAIKVADAAAAVSPSDTAIIATGEKFADALSISPYAYSYGVPMYFAQEDGTLDAATVNAIARGGYSHLIILGGTNVVSSDVEQQVGGASVTRIAGDNRYDTSSKIASYLIAHRLATIDNAAVATGQDFPDALTGAALCGRNSSVLLLADDTDTSAINSVIKTNQSNIYTLYLLGGTNVLSSNVEQQINAVLTKA
jgi:putative cell wall-binding protein